MDNCSVCGKDIIGTLHHSGEHGAPLCCAHGHPGYPCPAVLGIETQTAQTYILNCDQCGKPFESSTGFPSPQLCLACLKALYPPQFITKPSNAEPEVLAVFEGHKLAEPFCTMENLLDKVLQPSNAEPAPEALNISRGKASGKKKNDSASQGIGMLPPREPGIGEAGHQSLARVMAGLVEHRLEDEQGAGVAKRADSGQVSSPAETKERRKMPEDQGQVENPPAQILVEHRSRRQGGNIYYIKAEGVTVMLHQKEAEKLARAMGLKG